MSCNFALFCFSCFHKCSTAACDETADDWDLAASDSRRSDNAGVVASWRRNLAGPCDFSYSDTQFVIRFVANDLFRLVDKW